MAKQVGFDLLAPIDRRTATTESKLADCTYCIALTALSDLVAILANAEIDSILEDFGTKTRREDPIVHFYETFLRAYNPQLRIERGVYYAPSPVVEFMVRRVDDILRKKFGVEDGLADDEKIAFKRPGKVGESHRVLVLDPACGTGTFLYHVIDFLRENFRARKQGGMWSAYVGDHLLPRLFGFELLMAPYAVAHLKLGLIYEPLTSTI